MCARIRRREKRGASGFSVDYFSITRSNACAQDSMGGRIFFAFGCRGNRKENNFSLI